MPTTLELIGSTTLSSATATVSFSSIPSTWTDLYLRASIRQQAGGNAYLTLNGTYSGLLGQRLAVNANAATINSYEATDGFIGDGQQPATTANYFGNVEVYIPNYADSSRKNWYGEFFTDQDGSADSYMNYAAGLTPSSVAITTLALGPGAGSGTFASGSTFYLYGIKKG
jgi:hypothetical protein